MAGRLLVERRRAATKTVFGAAPKQEATVVIQVVWIRVEKVENIYHRWHAWIDKQLQRRNLIFDSDDETSSDGTFEETLRAAALEDAIPAQAEL